MNGNAELSNKLDQMVLQGQALEGFDEFYADEVSMQENSDPPFLGKELNRKREEEFFASVQEIHNFARLSTATEGDLSFSEWDMDVTLKNGFRMKASQVSVRRWRDGKIVSERFYYQKG